MSEEGQLQSDAVMRRWLRAALSGCIFAPRLAQAESDIIRYRTMPGPIDDQTVLLVNAAMTDAANHAKAIVVTFPLLRSSREIAHLIYTLCLNDRWERQELPANAEQIPGLRIALTWRTPRELASRVMGLAPLGSMPVTRRAPYVALCAWLGGHDNPHRQPQPNKPRKVLLFSDMPHGMPLDDHNKKYEESEQLTRELSMQTGDAPPGYKLTFCLDEDVRPMALG